MANVIRLKRASGSDPAASDLVSGEPAVRTDTGELFFKKDDGSVAKVSGAGGGPDFKYLALRNAANNGAASYPNADFTLVTSGTTTALTPTAANTLLVSVNGVIQKPNTGTSTPSSGFALSGSTIKFGGNISAAPDFILYQESGGIGEPSDETVGEDKLKVSNNPVNGYFLSAQSGNTGGLTWAAPVATSCTGNSATATALATARAINGVNFDGTAAITVTAAAGTLSGNTLNSSVTASSLTSLGDLTSLTVTGDLVVDTSTLKVDSSNNRVGIGTTSPSTTLNVTGTAAQAGIFQSNQSATTISVLDTDGDGLNISGGSTYGHRIHTNNTEKLELGVNNSTKLVIDSSGRVLVGTSSARSSGGAGTAHLQLEGTSSPSAEFLITRNSADSFSPTLGLVKTRGTSVGSNTTVADNDVLGTIQFRGADGSDIFSVGASIFARVNGTPSDGTDMPTELIFGTTADGASSPTERMVIDTLGNVGIGMSPGHRLDVQSTANDIARFSGANSGGITFRNDTSNEVQIHTGTSDALIFGTNGENERMRIASNGNVGIGTDNPGSRLEVRNNTATHGVLAVNRANDDAPALMLGNDSSHNALIATNQSDLRFGVDSAGTFSEKMRLDQNGHLLINQPSEAAGLIGIKGTNSNGSTCYPVSSSGKALEGIDITCTTVGDGNFGGAVSFGCGGNGRSAIAGVQIGSDDDRNGLAFFTHPSNNGADNAVEQMRINADGALLLGTTSVHSTGQVFSITGAAHIMEIQNTSTAGHRNITLRHARASGGTSAEQIVFEEENGGAVGSIQSTGSATSYNTSSDYRLKENATAISDGITRLKTLKPYRFNFKVDATTTVDGFFAHEVTAVPEAVTGTKDEVDSDNNPIYQGIDQSKIVPLLVAALQEAIVRIEALEAK